MICRIFTQNFTGKQFSAKLPETRFASFSSYRGAHQSLAKKKFAQANLVPSFLPDFFSLLA